MTDDVFEKVLVGLILGVPITSLLVAFFMDFIMNVAGLW